MDDRETDTLREIEDQAKEYIEDREFDLAVSICEEAESKGLHGAELYAAHASALTYLERWEEAWALINEKLEEYPGPSLINALAFIGNQRGNYKYTLDICDWASSIGVWSSKIAARKSGALIGLMRYNEAVDFIKQELEKYPDETALYQNLSTALGATGRHDLALSVCKEAEARSLSSGGLYAAHSVALIGLKKWPEASALIDDKLQEYTNEPSLYQAQAYLSSKRRKYEKAIAICDYTASIGVWDLGLATVKAVALLRQRRYKQAVGFIKQQLEKYPDSAVLHASLGSAYRLTLKMAESKEEYKTAKALVPAMGGLLKKQRMIRDLIFLFIFTYLLLGIIFWPSSRYFIVALCLLLVGLGALSLFLSLRNRQLMMAILSLFIILIFGFLGYIATFGSGSVHFKNIGIHFGSSNTSEIDDWIQELKDDNAGMRRLAADELGSTGNPRAVDPLVAVLEDSDSDVRIAAAEGLGKIGDPRVVDPLITALGDGDEFVRDAAALALGKLGDPRAVEPVIAALKDSGAFLNYIGDLAYALSEFGTPAVEPLIAALEESNSNVRWGSAEALGQIGDPAAVPALMEALKDEDAGVRFGAAQALGKIGDPRAVAVLNEASKDKDASVRAAATEALNKINSKS